MSRKAFPVSGHKLTVAYEGTGYHGWQRQAEHPSIQEEVEKVLAQIWGEPVTLEGSGRTDTGVHARGQVASFTAPRKLPTPILLRALNDHLPLAIRVTKVEFVEPAFHARFDVTWKTYEYRIHNAPFSDPFLLNRAMHVPQPLDLAAMEAAAALLRGKHDFAALATNPGYTRPNTIRTVSALEVKKSGTTLLIRVTANGFLYHMVRNIVGALVKIGKGKLPLPAFQAMLASRKRVHAPAAAPAYGLYLLKVVYHSKAVRLERSKNRRPPPPETEADAE